MSGYVEITRTVCGGCGQCAARMYRYESWLVNGSNDPATRREQEAERDARQVEADRLNLEEEAVWAHGCPNCC